MQTHGCEKSRRLSDFYTYLTEEVGFLNLPFICFKGNRSNVLFYNGGILYYFHDHLLHFFDIVKDDNKLLKAVHSDLQIQSYLCGCRALGLINKFVTGIHILDLNKHHQKMCSLFFDLYVDASEFMLGNVIFFENIEISKDDIYNSLLLSSDILDETTKQCLEIIFGSLCIVTRRMLNDHLKDGKYANPCEQLYKETVSVSTTNSIAERNFGMLDRLIREKPNANIIKYEAINMNRRNKTSEWRKTLSPEKRSLMMKWARQYASKQYQLFKQRRTESRKAKNEKRLDKIEEARRKECRNRLIKERLCAEISQYGRFWLKEEQIDAKLPEMRTDSEKRAALKCQ